MTAREFADKHMQPYKLKGSELVPVYCPYCHGGSHRDKDTFALNSENMTFNCRRGSCNKQGHFVELCRDFGESADADGERAPRKQKQPDKTFKRPEKKPETITLAAASYLRLRGISQETADAYGVGVDDKGNLMFPYYDEDGEHVFSKFRPARKINSGERKMWREAGTKPVLFGMHLCKPEMGMLTITEGEIDALSCYEAGITNVVSIPSGTEDFSWIDTCWDFLGRYDDIALFGDNDEAGLAMIKKLKAKLSDHRLWVVKHDEKDANLLLYRQGKLAVVNAWSEAEEVQVAGLINLASVTPLDPKDVRKATSGIKGIDRILGGFLLGDVTVWTGKRASGKSTVLSQVMLDAIEQGYSVCAYSGELKADQFQYWTDLQAAGRANIQEYFDANTQRDVRYLDRQLREAIHTWYNRKYWLYDNTATLEDEERDVIKIFERAAKRYDCSVFMIDNLMTVDYGSIKERDFNLLQTKFVNALAKFANMHNAHVHLVAHPRKTSEINDSDEVSGTGNITNRAANVISVSRCDMGSDTDVTLKVLKNRWEGQTGDVKLMYDGKSRRVYEPGETPSRQYGWEAWREATDAEREDEPW